VTEPANTRLVLYQLSVAGENLNQEVANYIRQSSWNTLRHAAIDRQEILPTSSATTIHLPEGAFVIWGEHRSSQPENPSRTLAYTIFTIPFFHNNNKITNLEITPKPIATMELPDTGPSEPPADIPIESPTEEPDNLGSLAGQDENLLTLTGINSYLFIAALSGVFLGFTLITRSKIVKK